MKLPLPALALLAPLAFALAPLGCDGGDEGDDEAADTTNDMDTTDGTDTGEPDPVAGQMIHDSTCAVAGCHSAADMVQLSERVPMLDDAGLTDQIRNGGTGPEGTMPAFNENQIDPTELANLIAFLRQEYG
jgi:hypothetical protein